MVERHQSLRLYGRLCSYYKLLEKYLRCNSKQKQGAVIRKLINISYRNVLKKSGIREELYESYSIQEPIKHFVVKWLRKAINKLLICASESENVGK
jgi:hypothetical protein